MQAAIASHQNVAESVIVRVEEWASVIFAVVKGLGARFVSKKIVKRELSIPKMEQVGSRWTKHGKDRIYFDSDFIADSLKLSNSKRRKIAGNKFYYDLVAKSFCWQKTSHTHDVEGWSDLIAEQCSGSKVDQKSCYNCGLSQGSLLGGSLGLLCPDCYDDIESYV